MFLQLIIIYQLFSMPALFLCCGVTCWYSIIINSFFNKQGNVLVKRLTVGLYKWKPLTIADSKSLAFV